MNAIARAFVEARHAGAALADYPGEFPRSLEEAYAIQAEAIRLHGDRIAGWKVGRIPAPLVATLGTDRLAGPIFAASVVAAEGEVPAMPVFGDGFAAAEAEYLLHVGSLPDRFDQDWTNAAVAEYVDAVHVGIEVASSPFPGINEHGPAVTISDFGNNNGLVIGEPLPRDADLLGWPVALAINGVTVGEATAAAMLDGPFGAVRFLFEQAAAGRVPLAAGQWVSTGAVTGVHPVRPGDAVETRFGAGHRVACTIRAII